MGGGLLGQGQIGEHVHDRDVELLRHLVAGDSRLHEVIAGVEEEDVDAGEVLGDEVGEDAVGHRAGDHDSRPDGVGQPGQHLVRRRPGAQARGTGRGELPQFFGRVSPSGAGTDSWVVQIGRHDRASSSAR